MLDKNPDITRLCDKLVEKKLILRNYNKTNRRQILLKISEKGIKALDEINPMFNLVNINLKTVDDNELLMLSDVLDKVRATFKA
jgi:DNA-binding MarR family transcriptional regulator